LVLEQPSYSEMKKFIFLFLIILLYLSANQCTSTRWTVVDLHSIDEREEPEKLDSDHIIMITDSATIDQPFLNLNLFEVKHLEFTERVLVERTIQQYRPRWGFTMLGTLGAAIAFYAGNTDGFIDNQTAAQTTALNSTGVLLTSMAFMNMKPVGDPIHTGETNFLRRSGSTVIPDTTAASDFEDFQVNIKIEYQNEVRLNDTFNYLNGNSLRINLASLLENKTISGLNPGSLDVEVSYLDETDSHQIPVNTFMSPIVMVTTPVAELKNNPIYDESNTLAEVGNGSELILLDNRDDQWFQVRFGGSDVYIPKESGEIQWKAADIIADPTVITIDEVPFGEISVEYAVPVLKPANTTDTGIILSNHRNNQIGIRRYIDRDFRLMELYYRDAFGITSSNIRHIDVSSYENTLQQLEQVNSDSTSTVHVYLGAYARTRSADDGNFIELIYLNDDEELLTFELSELLTRIASKPANKLIIFLDLEFPDQLREGELPVNNGVTLFRDLTESVLELNENSALIFSSRPDQQTGIYESVRFEQKYHHIFPYYIAQALQQRRTELNSLVRYIENQVDYTSRRLHDRPQTIQAFGNLSLNISN
jgi:hypothetical protein